VYFVVGNAWFRPWGPRPPRCADGATPHRARARPPRRGRPPGGATI